MLRDAGIVVRPIGLGFAARPAYHAYRGCHPRCLARGAAPDMLAMCQTLLRIEAGNPAQINDFHYLSLLHGSPPPDKIIPRQTQLAEPLTKRCYFARKK
jgi:hypothetical protein